MGYNTCWDEGEATLTHLSDEAWAELTASLTAHIQDAGEIGSESGFFRWEPEAATDPSKRVIYYGEMEGRIDHDDVCLGFTIIAPHLLPPPQVDGIEQVAAETVWDGDDSGDRGVIHVYAPEGDKPARVEYCPVVEEFPVAATYIGGDLGPFIAERKRAAEHQAAWEAERKERQRAEHAWQHTQAEALGLDGYAEHLVNSHYHREPVKPSAIMAAHTRAHEEKAGSWSDPGPADALGPDPDATLATIA